MTDDQDKKTYLFCYSCKVQRWYEISGDAEVHIDAVQCQCGVWLQ